MMHTLFHRVCSQKVSQASPETINIYPRCKAASKRVSTPAGAGKDFPCHYVKCCPAFGQRTVTWLRSRSLCLSKCSAETNVIMLREDMSCISQLVSGLRIFSGISCCCTMYIPTLIEPQNDNLIERHRDHLWGAKQHSKRTKPCAVEPPRHKAFYFASL